MPNKSAKTENSLVVIGSSVTGRCVDCRQLFMGPLAVNFISTKEGPGVEVNIADRVHGLHCIARVKREDIPVVVVPDGKHAN